MSLDLKNKAPAYICGRLLAIFEKIQLDSLNKDKGRNIKDVYFSLASVNPSAVFPKLFQLSNNNLKKLSTDDKIYYQKLIGEVINKLDSKFPTSLNDEQQGEFIIGYYHQVQEFSNDENNK